MNAAEECVHPTGMLCKGQKQGFCGSLSPWTIVTATYKFSAQSLLGVLSPALWSSLQLVIMLVLLIETRSVVG